MAERVVLTDKLVKALRPGDRRFDVLDALCPGFLVQVQPSGRITFQLRSRIGANWPVRRVIGQHSHLTVEQARRTARQWLELLHQGGSPEVARQTARDEQKRARDAAAAAVANTVAVVADKFIARKLKEQRRGKAVANIIRNELLPAWDNRPIGDISHRDVREAVDKVIERGAATYAHNVLDATRALFAFAVDHDLIEHNPCDRLKRRHVIGHKKHRERVLNDDELRALWRASGRLGYPFGPLYQLLVLTGARLNEVSGARWREFDFNNNNTWTVPAERFKAGHQHMVPLTDDAIAVLRELPRFRRGDCLFSTSFGDKPVNGWSKAKQRIDRLMLQTLRALARLRGDEPAEVRLEPWVNHDVRRTVRTRLSALRVQDHIAEQVIGHGRRGIARVYDQHKFEVEKREALDKWQALLRSIVAPPPSNVVALRSGEGA